MGWKALVALLALYSSHSVSKPSAEQQWLATPQVKCIERLESATDYRLVDWPYSGAMQWLESTWQSVSGLPGIAADYSPAVQDEMAYRLFLVAGWYPWPHTAPACGA